MNRSGVHDTAYVIISQKIYNIIVAVISMHTCTQMHAYKRTLYGTHTHTHSSTYIHTYTIDIKILLAIA